MKDKSTKTILIVDNNEEDIEEISKIVKEMGYNFIGIDSADSAVTQIKRGLEYDCLIVDDYMKSEGIEHHGGELVAMVSKKKNPKTKVIMVFAWGPHYKENVDKFLNKFDSNLYSLIIKRCLKEYL